MEGKDILKVIALVPLILGGTIALMVLSYIAVPLIIISIVVFIAYMIVKAGED